LVYEEKQVTDETIVFRRFPFFGLPGAKKRDREGCLRSRSKVGHGEPCGFLRAMKFSDRWNSGASVQPG
jgi:hypothetical protein